LNRVEDHSNRVEFYPDAEEEIFKDLHPKNGPRIRVSVYVDTAGILVMLNNPPIRSISKC
jgi:hypothetical protein